MSDMPHAQKQSQVKRTDELLIVIHTCMACSLVYLRLLSGGKICELKWWAYKTPSCKFVTFSYYQGMRTTYHYYSEKNLKRIAPVCRTKLLLKPCKWN